jgi:hypothetical protein
MLSPGSSDTSLYIYQNMRRDNPEYIHFILFAREPQIAYSIYNSASLRMDAEGTYIYQNTYRHTLEHINL